MMPTMMRWTFMIALMAAGIALAAEPRPDDWPSFRGSPTQRGLATGAVDDDPALLWSFETGGPVKSTAAIVADRVYVGSEDGHLYCLDLASGELKWRFEAGKEIEASPLVVDGRVYFGAADGVFRCVNAGDGVLQWTFEAGDKILGGANAGRAEDGSTVIVFGSYDCKVYALNAADGQLRWTHETGNYVNGTPAISDGVVIVGGCDGFLHRIGLNDGGARPAIEIGAYIAGSAAVDGDMAWIGHYGNKLAAVDMARAAIAWDVGPRAFAVFSSPAVIQDKVIYGCRDRRVYAVRRGDGSPVWEFRTRGKVDSSPVVVGTPGKERVIIASEDGRVYMLKLGDGTEAWSYLIGQAIVASPAVSGERFVIGGEDGRVYCFGPEEEEK